jgi:hypothetical protein
MNNSEAFDITNNTELAQAVRSETQYDTQQLDVEDLAELVNSAKRELALRAGVTDFYGDRGLAVALLGTVCAKAKGAVENSPVVTKDISGQNVTFRASDGESLQLAQYEDMVQRGLSHAAVVDDAVQNIEITHGYYTESSSEPSYDDSPYRY